MLACPMCEAEIAEGTGVCPHCGSDRGGMIAAPADTPRTRWTHWLAILCAAVVFGAVVLFFAARSASHLSGSVCHLRVVGLATINSTVTHHGYPPAVESTPQHAGYGWAVAILRDMDQSAVYEAIDFAKPWDDPANAAILSTEIPGYRNPAISEVKDERGNALIHYAGNVRLLGRVPALAPEDVTDGSTNTLMIGEVDAGFRPWADPGTLRDPAAGLNRGASTFGSPWKDGRVYFAIADGSVSAVPGDTSPDVLRALATPAGGEVVTFPE
ncbi:MAG: DUF1559 domain-containing protein [Planctomycetaceae bacterium]